ncbi:MAG TPA: sigma-70 family RNA polymerase sigma factor [Chthoniobacter sp.]|nr:sigma-70 family RNA polymerase sigma factor [Chthoniobacter sp.]
MKTPTDFDALGADYELMKKIAVHQSDALSQLHARYHDVLHYTVMQIVHDDADADEVVQDVFTQLWTHPGAYCAAKGKPLCWMLTLSRRRAIDCVRRRHTYRRASERFELDSRPRHTQAQKELSTDRAASRDDLREYLVSLLGQLPAAQQLVLVRSFFGQMSQRQIAAASGTPLGTIKTRMELGLKKLAQLTLPVREMVE